MTLSNQDKALVKDTFAKVAPIADQAAEMFYNRLFEIDPATQSLFTKTDMSEQGRKLMQMIGVAVAALDHLDQIVPALESLGQRHEGYGVTLDQYNTVGEALIWTLGQGLGDEFTPEVSQAWVKVYTTLVEVATKPLLNKA